ncbi:hypothetical protein HKD42_04610 [Altererythrobacter sp. RZ02]|uniref:Uncharacterized protein n=1 Tax=Pontixanthobacter rizhaonensis TaxID=2730337 RepID=A0A848QJS7_9SPHN|nr:hypothetical protein [Pontixanthobacter rizhaonensis]NMW31334.1 hypothetical protein [Pontixanthobacter rizhaonensis]
MTMIALLSAPLFSIASLSAAHTVAEVQEVPASLSERAQKCVADHRELIDTNEFSAENKIKLAYVFTVLGNDASKVENGIDGIRPTTIQHGAPFAFADVRRNIGSTKPGSGTLMLAEGQLAYIYVPEELESKETALDGLKSMCTLFDDGIQLVLVDASVRIL